MACGRSVRVIHRFFTIEFLPAQRNCDRIDPFSACRTGRVDRLPVCNTIAACGDRVPAILALCRNRHGRKAAVIRDVPVPDRLGIFRHSVTNGRDARLLHLDPIAHRAVAAFRQTVLGAGSRLGGIGDDGVSLGGHLLLRHQNFFAHAAVAALGLARFGAGSCNRGVCCRSVACGFDRYRFIYDLFAVLAFCFPCPSVLGTGCRLFPFTDTNIQMPAGRDHFLCFQHRIAVIAMAATGQTGLCTGCRFAFVCDWKMIFHCVWFLHCAGRRIASAAQCKSAWRRIGHFFVRLTGRFFCSFVSDAVGFRRKRLLAVQALRCSRYTCKALSVCIVPGPAHFIRHIVGRTGIFILANRANRRFRAFGRHCHVAGHIDTVRLLSAVAAFVYTQVLSIVPVCAIHIDVCTFTVRTFCHRTIIANRCYRHQQCRQQKNGQQALHYPLVHRLPPLNLWVVRSARCSALPLFY